MELFEVFAARHSIRAFTDQPVPDEALGRIFEAVNRAPSAGNLQAFEIYQVTQPSHREALMRASLDQEFIAQAPLVLVFCAAPARSAVRYTERGETLYCIQERPSPVPLPCWRRPRWDWEPCGWAPSMRKPCTASSARHRTIDRSPYCPSDIQMPSRATVRGGRWRTSSTRWNKVHSRLVTADGCRRLRSIVYNQVTVILGMTVTYFWRRPCSKRRSHSSVPA